MPPTQSIAATAGRQQELLRLCAFMFCDDSAFGDAVAASLAGVPGVLLPRRLPLSAKDEDIVRALRVYAPNVIFLETEDLQHTERLITLVRQHISGVAVIGMHRNCSAELLLQVMRIGIQEFLTEPVVAETVAQCCERVRFHLLQNPSKASATDLVYSFLPAKAGVGASTIAANCASMAADAADEGVFLGDFDLNSGIIRFMLRLKTQYSIVDAVKRGRDLDRTQWEQIVETRGNLHVVHAGNIDLDQRIDPDEVRDLVSFARRSYKMVCADLSGNLEKFSLEIMRESKSIFLVTTPELPALHLARQKVRFLESLGLGSQIAIVLNRHGKRQLMNVEEIEATLGAKVVATCPNDYAHLHGAIQNGSSVSKSTPLGAEYWKLAQRMLAVEASKPEPPKGLLGSFFRR